MAQLINTKHYAKIGFGGTKHYSKRAPTIISIASVS